MTSKLDSARDKTIRDFGDQWVRHQENEGYYAGQDLFADLVEPLIPAGDFAGARVAEIGAGTGRITTMIARAGAAEVVAVEPSAAYDVLVRNTAGLANVRCVRVRGEDMPREDFDIVASIGVIHHIPDPAPVMRAAFESTRPGGRVLIWLYGHEGNSAYLAFALPLRALTRRLPFRINNALAGAMELGLSAYIGLCRRSRARLPMRDYMLSVLGRFDRHARRLVIADQLNPEWAKYYRREEAIALLEHAGFTDVRAHHRHGYSWTVVGVKPA